MVISQRHMMTIKRSRGAALIVSLLLLLVMTILGVAAMNSSIMQGFMSSSYQQQTATLTGVENILLEGEREVEAIVTRAAGVPLPENYYIDLLGSDEPAEFNALGDEIEWNIGAPATLQVIGNFDIPGRFVIEYLGEFEVPGESIAEGGGLEDSRIHVFRVSARGQETVREGLRVVQSLYVTLRGPGD